MIKVEFLAAEGQLEAVALARDVIRQISPDGLTGGDYLTIDDELGRLIAVVQFPDSCSDEGSMNADP